MRMRREERRKGLRQKFGERVGVGEHAHLTRLPARIAPEVLTQPLRLRQDRARVLQQCAAGLRRRHTRAASGQQRGAERLLHLANSRARCGERKMRAFRAVRDAARLDDMAEQAQIGEVEAHVISYNAKADYAE
jgi:hypothetical protein